MSRSRPLLDWLEDTSDWLSPIVVKEVRQVVRGREFHYSFGVSLVVGLAVAFFGAADALDRKRHVRQVDLRRADGLPGVPRPGGRAARRVQRAAQRAAGADARAHHADRAVAAPRRDRQAPGAGREAGDALRRRWRRSSR